MMATTAAVVRKSLISVRKWGAGTIELNAGNACNSVTKDGAVRYQHVDGRWTGLVCPGVKNLLVNDQGQPSYAHGNDDIYVSPN